MRPKYVSRGMTCGCVSQDRVAIYHVALFLRPLVRSFLAGYRPSFLTTSLLSSSFKVLSKTALGERMDEAVRGWLARDRRDVLALRRGLVVCALPSR